MLESLAAEHGKLVGFLGLEEARDPRPAVRTIQIAE